MLRLVEHGKSFITSGPDTSTELLDNLFSVCMLLVKICQMIIVLAFLINSI